MSNKVNKVIAIGSLVAMVGGCKSSDKIVESTNDGKNQWVEDNSGMADSVALVQRLKELATLKYDTVLPMSAMCYSIASPIQEDYVCPTCGTATPSTAFANGNIKSIVKKVEQMKMMGYDVKLDQSNYCEHCSGKKVEKPELVFMIRFSKDAPYHIAKSNIYAEYEAVAQFLRSKNDFVTFVNNDKSTAEENFLIIKKMTGLSY